MPSALEEYSRNYSARLRAALDGTDQGAGPGSALEPQTRLPPNDRQAGAGAYVPPQDPVVPEQPGGSADFDGGPDMGGPMAGDQQQPDSPLAQKSGGYTFRQAWADAPEKAKEKELNKLEESLKRGNQTIDDAYADLERQLGTRPEKKKLTRQEKGMLLMEFGLNVLANNKKGLGAIGEAGGKALKGYGDIAYGPQREYDATLGAVRGAKARDKVDLAKAAAIEGMKVSKDQLARLPGKFVGDDGLVYFYDEMGAVKKALDENGKPIKGSMADRTGGQGREFESDAKYARYMEIYGVDPNTGRPLEGLALQGVKQDALEFANDRGKSIDDLDLDILAEQSADKEMGADAYRDLTPEEREAQRSKIVSSRRSRLRLPVRSHLEGRPEPTRGRPGAKRRFASEADAKAAFRRGEIKVGDTIIVNGVEGPVE